MTQAVAAPGKPGRPYIGPKAQTNVPVPVYNYAIEEAATREVPLADVWREMLEEAYARRIASGGKP